MQDPGVQRGGDRKRRRSGAEAEATAALDRGEADVVQDELAQDSQVVSGTIGAYPHLVVAKGHIHAPVQAILGTQAQADCSFMRYCASGARLPVSERRSVDGRLSSDRSVVITANDGRSGQRWGACRQSNVPGSFVYQRVSFMLPALPDGAFCTSSPDSPSLNDNGILKVCTSAMTALFWGAHGLWSTKVLQGVT